MGGDQIKKYHSIRLTLEGKKNVEKEKKVPLAIRTSVAITIMDKADNAEYNKIFCSCKSTFSTTNELVGLFEKYG